MPDTFIFLRRGVPVTITMIDIDATLREERAVERCGLLFAHGRDAALQLRQIHRCQMREVGTRPAENTTLIFFAAWQVDVAGIWLYALSGGGALMPTWRSWEDLDLLDTFQDLLIEFRELGEQLEAAQP